MIEKESQAATSRILAMHAEAASLHTIAAKLNNDGMRTSRGTRWSAQSVARVIADGRYPKDSWR